MGFKTPHEQFLRHISNVAIEELYEELPEEEQVWKNIDTELGRAQSNLPLSLDQFRSFVNNARGKQNISELASEYTTYTINLITMIQNLHGKMNKSLKNRCTRILRRLLELPRSTTPTIGHSPDPNL